MLNPRRARRPTRLDSGFQAVRPRMRGSEVTRVNRFLGTIVSWLRAGYPNGVPSNDYLPILALLSRRLSCDEVTEVAKLMDRLPHPGFVDIGVEILRITDQLPAPADVERVRALLAANGWPLDDPRDDSDDPRDDEVT